MTQVDTNVLSFLTFNK